MTTKQQPKPTPCEPPPAQCANGRHYFDVKDGKLVSDVCRCGNYKRRKMT